ncbi:unnamed protein product [Effrenium voratum]|uniref:Uncharacterized protein n=1 Tax=Effrenium voratum TaxID=2562239 RepID=A0AA36JMF4_9DINO|nr:unnamed protein product [Effrenium voratum]
MTTSPCGAAGEPVHGLASGGRVVDCIIPAHEKDYETLSHAVRSLRQFCPEVRRILVLSSSPPLADCEVEWLDEADPVWPFRRSDLEGCGCGSGWLLQQLLKLYAPVLLEGLADDVLVCDADVVWLQPVRFLLPSDSGAYINVFNTHTCPPIRSAVDLHRYDGFVPAILPGLQKPRPKETAVCHHMVLQKRVLKQLMEEVELACGRSFWQAYCEAAKATEGRASEYELYYAFAISRCVEVQTRMLSFAVVADMEAVVKADPPPASFAVAHSHLRALSAEELRDREGIINGDTEREILRRLTEDQPAELSQLLLASGMFGAK